MDGIQCFVTLVRRDGIATVPSLVYCSTPCFTWAACLRCRYVYVLNITISVIYSVVAILGCIGAMRFIILVRTMHSVWF